MESNEDSSMRKEVKLKSTAFKVFNNFQDYNAFLNDFIPRGEDV